MSGGPEQRSWVGAKAPLAVKSLLSALRSVIKSEVLEAKVCFPFHGECRRKDPAAAWLQLLPGDPAGNKGPRGEGTPQRLPLDTGVSRKTIAWANYGDE